MRDETDEILIMAYVDGELPPDQRAAVESRLIASPELRALEQEMRESREMLSQAFAAEGDRPVPDSLRDLVADAEIEEVDAVETNVVSLASFMRRPAFREVRRYAAVAACLLLAAGLGIGGLVVPMLGGGVGSPILSAELQAVADPNTHAALDRTLSGEVVAWRSVGGNVSGRIMPIATFESGPGRYCRHFTQEVIAPDGGTRLQAVACRTNEGGWSTSIVMVSPGPSAPKPDTYVTASGPSEEAFSKAAAALGTASALDPAAERSLIDRWSRD